MNNQLIENLKRILDNNDIEDYTNDSLERCTRKLFETNEQNLITSFDIELGDEELLLLIKKESLTISDFEDSLNQLSDKVDLSNIDKVLLLDIYQNTKNLHNNSKDHISKLRKLIQGKLKEIKKNNKFLLRNIEYNSHLLVQIPDEKTLSISINNRIQCLENELAIQNSCISLKSFVFTATLQDVISLYDNVGDRLFQNNLRIGLSEQLNVDNSIKSTLANNSGEFWFLNNGISIYVPDENLMSLAKFDELQLTIKSSELISVINGAQTISTVARTNYSKNDSSVLLRIFTFSTQTNKETGCTDNSIKDEKNINKEIQKKQIDKITVALNRQKPIKQEDIAYTYDFTYQMNNLDTTTEFQFELIRRGESESINSRQFILSNFARLTKAYLGQKPGDARSKGISTLLKEDSDKPGIFNDQDIFKRDENLTFNDLFNKYYKPVNFSFELKKLITENFLKDLLKKLESNEKIENIESIKVLIKYGRYFLIALTINIINKNNNDFSKWQYTNIKSDSVNEDTNHIYKLSSIEKLITDIFKNFAEFISDANYKDIDSNMFKKNELYEKFKNKNFNYEND
ncbi:AIPR family protein [Staphylococcus caeli]|uniref:AIPR protein n=1 Tax=Staphylococcus caeli TaxID=2201815 RepID=A0A1D4IY38_9STAP|nr:AIPR family protein [Staphylococcus caeli]SCS36484.1 AIPR protein [Staphylococcus caeli]SCS54475.1 AIPR protein [Staphylococcus caeli]